MVASRAMVDYSRFDKLARELSDDEEESAAPRVTRFEAPQTVVIGSDDGGAQERDTRVHGTSEKPTGVEETRGRVEELPSEDDVLRQWAVDGSVEPDFVWSQTKDAAQLWLLVAQGARAKDVRVELTEGDEGNSTLRVWLAGEVVVDEVLYDAVQKEEDGVLDWELVDITEGGSRRAIRIGVTKRSYGEGVYRYWQRFFKDLGSDIDTATLSCRATPKKNFQEVWDEAHRMFREKVKNSKPQNIELED